LELLKVYLLDRLWATSPSAQSPSGPSPSGLGPGYPELCYIEFRVGGRFNGLMAALRISIGINDGRAAKSGIS